VHIQSAAKASLFYAPKIIKMGGRTTKLQSIEKWRVSFISRNNMQQILNFSFSM